MRIWIRIRLFTLMRIRIHKVLKWTHIPYILACHLQIDDPDFFLDADPDGDPDPDFYLMRMRIQVTKMMRIRIHNTVRKNMLGSGSAKIHTFGRADPDPDSKWWYLFRRAQTTSKE
jgi:hypothetical protein